MKIELLTHCPEAIPCLARLWYDTLGQLWVPDISIANAELKFREHLNEEVLPLTLVALEDNEPIGMCSLRENDGIRHGLRPWMGSLIVQQHYQRQGVGAQLMNAVKEKAREKKFDELYLFTFDQTLPNYYRRHGWEEIGKDIFKTHEVTVMKTLL